MFNLGNQVIEVPSIDVKVFDTLRVRYRVRKSTLLIWMVVGHENNNIELLAVASWCGPFKCNYRYNISPSR